MPENVTFVSGETSQIIAFAATDDTADDDDETVALGFGTPPTGVTAGTTSTTTVTITDNDAPGLVISPTSLSITEEGAGASYTVRLAMRPTAEVRVNIGGAFGSDLSISAIRLTFTRQNWDADQTVTVSSVHDDDSATDTVVLTHGATSTGSDYSGLSGASVTVTVTDNDTPMVTVAPTRVAMAEGGSNTYTIRLATQPTADVTVTIDDPTANTEVTAEPEELTFTSTTWASEQTVTVSAAVDADTANDEATITHTAAGAEYEGVSVPDVTVRVIEDISVEYDQATYAVGEGETVEVTLTLSADPERTVTVPLTATPQGDAVAGDYTAPASVTFQSGETSAVVTFGATQDEEDDNDEQVVLGFPATLPTGITAGSVNEATVTITDDDAPDRVGVSWGAATYTVAEGETQEITVELDKAPERAVTIGLRAQQRSYTVSAGGLITERVVAWTGGVTAPDFSGVPVSVTFGSEETSQTITFAATDDAVDDDDETVELLFAVTLPDGIEADTPSTTTVSITDNDAPANVYVFFGATSYTVGEGSTVSVEVKLNQDPERTVTIPITATPGDGAEAADFSVPADVTFAAGETSQTIAFAATDDTADDDDETVALGFGTPPSGVTAGTPSATTVKITDDDDPQVTVSFGAATYTVGEGSSVSVEVKLDADPERTVVIPITATPGDGAEDADFSGVPASVTFNSGETSKAITFTADDDTVDDDDETVALGFGTPPTGVTAGTTSTTTVNITDDDDPAVTVSFGAASYTVTEGSSVDVEVKLDADPERTVVIPITATPGDGAQAADFSGVPVSVTFVSGETSQIIAFAATDDTVDDDGETVALGFGTPPTGVSAGTTSTTTVTITDNDDPAVTVSFGAATYTVTEGSSVDVEVKLDADPERTVVIPITATPGDGAETADFSVAPNNVTFAAGETSQTITFAATDDTADDDGETVALGFGTPPTGVSAGTTSTTTVTITDNDDPAVTVSFGAATYTVGEGSSVDVEVKLDADPERTVVIPITATPGDGAEDADFSGVPASVTFNSGETSKAITFTADEDTVDDDGETVALGFGTPPSGVTAGTTSTTTVTITDNDDPAVTVSFGAATYTVGEGSSVDVEVKLDADPERTVVIPITATPGDGAETADFSVAPNNVTFAAGETSQTITFAATDDTADDDGETVALGFGTPPTGVSAGTTSTTTVTITDNDDPAVTVSFGAASYTVTEGSSVDVEVKLDADPERTVVIPITATPGDGAEAADFSVAPENVTFAAGETSQTITFAATDDAADDDGETVALGFGTPPTGVSAGTTSTTTVTITDNDDPAVTVSFGAATYTVTEGSSVDVEVKLDADPERTVVIPITATPGDGAETADFSVAPNNVTFAAGETSQTITFAATDDTADDDGETVALGFGTPPSGVTAGTTSTTTVTITDNDDPAVTVSFGAASYTVTEGSSVDVEVKLDADPERTVVIPITATPGDGAQAADFSGVPVSVTFVSGETSQIIAFAATDDTADDDGETVALGFGTPPSGVTAGTTSTTTVTITDNDDPAVTVSFGAASYTVTEGSSVDVEVKLDADPERTVVIPITATPGDGAEDADFSGVPASVTFNSGETSKAITFTADEDTVDDDGETVALGFGTPPTGVTAGTTSTTTVTITDNDDPAVTVSFGAATYTVTEGSTVSVEVKLNQDPERTVVIPITATPGNGAEAADYSGVPANVTFASGDTSKTFTFTAADDTADDDGETVALGFGTPPSGVTAGTTSTTTVTITDNDDPAVTVSFGAATYTVTEGSTVSVEVKLDQDPERTVAIPITSTPGDGAEAADYSGVPENVTFAAGETSKTFTFTATDDSADDDGETVALGFGTRPTGVTAGTTSTTTVTITDNDDPAVTVSFGAASYTVTEGSSVDVEVKLDADPERTVVIPITATPGDGAQAADFSGVPVSVTFVSGETSQIIAFAATDDTADDDDETVALGFGTPPTGVTAGTTSTTTVTITDNDEPPVTQVTQVTVSFGAASYTVAEGSTVSVEVKLDADPERTVVIPITATPGNGAVAADYSGVPANVTFAAGETSKTFTFSATDDTADDDGETVALGFGTPPSGVSAGTTSTTTVTITDNDDPAITVSFGAASYTVTEGSTVSVGVSLNQDPERTVAIPITATPGDGATAADYSGVPQNVTFDSGETQKSFVFTAETDTDDDHGESVRLSFDSMPDARMSEGSPSEAMVTITDAPRQNPGGNVGASGTVVTITRVPNGTVIPDHSSLWVGETVDDGSTFVEGTRALFRLEFEAVGGGPPVGDGVDLEMSYDWRHDSPLVTTHGQVVRTTLSLLWAEVWDTAVQIHDNDVGHPDGTVTIRITGCTRSGCIIGTPSELTLTIADDDGGPVAAVPGPPGVPRLVCAPSGDGYDNTGIAASWKAPAFVGGAPVESYELRYRESSRFVGGTLIEHPWESWPHGVAATSATLTGLVTGANYMVQVRAVNGTGPGLWSEPWYFLVGPTHEICEIIDRLTP